MQPKKIKRLPEIIANKIAAGEVVERPVSVVKELIENAIDAESTRVRIDIEKGGTQLIRLSDNGIGMHRDSALLSLERHATSKISTDDDLFSIKTLGFRGEALPSIAAISKMTLITRPSSSEFGTEIQIDGGKIVHVNDAGAPSGTFITVKDIFFNTPARKKYMKSIRTETAHIIDYISNIAVGFPSIHFRLFHNGKSVKNWPQAKDASIRIADIMGDDLYQKLFPVNYKNDHVTIEGYVASPETSRKSSNSVLFVNGRAVKDRLINHAIFEGYRGRLLKGQHPVVVLFLTVPFEDVDVNVHPAKHSVRFVHQGSIHQAVVKAIQNGLLKTNRNPWQPPIDKKIPENKHFPSKIDTHQVNPQKIIYGNQKKLISPYESDTVHEDQPQPNFVNNSDNCEQSSTVISNQPENSKQFSEEPINFKNLHIIGQFSKTYIICENDHSMFLIDQHAAHERIVYERLKKALLSKKIPVQRLLVPETIELTHQQASIFSELMPELQKMGMDINHFGGNTFVVQSVPDILTGKNINRLLLEISDTLPNVKSTIPIDQAIDDCIMLMACHSAIRSGQTLSTPEIRSLLNELDNCHNPSQCPHGRPTCIQWDGTFIEKRFKRIL
ncbi:DNA mismatch repair protein MutL [Candidatus Magnetomorum sp. HK-1]|nr:DNA mismatch repair protein MutL [Candidatus Magnetomorum sp. HK-1]